MLVHGAFADGTSWSQVIPRLEEQGFNVTAVQNPLTSLADSISLPEGFAWFVRIGLPVAGIVMPRGFFLSVASPKSERPNAAIQLVYVGARILATSVLILGVGLVRAAL